MLSVRQLFTDSRKSTHAVFPVPVHVYRSPIPERQRVDGRSGASPPLDIRLDASEPH